MQPARNYLSATQPVRRDDFRSERLRVLAVLHLYVPERRAGGEVYVHQILRHLAARGHLVRVCCDTSRSPYSIDGVEVVPFQNHERLTEHWADIALTHLDHSREAHESCTRHRRPIAHVVHNHWQLAYHGISGANLFIINSHWVEQTTAMGRWGTDVFEPRDLDSPWLVAYPVVRAADHQVTRTGEHVTLVNLTRHKGAGIFYSLARRHPDWTFLGVQGAYGDQIVQEMPNVTIWPNQQDMRRVWEQTRVLIAPSDYESYGMAAVEASCAGIPVVASATDGLRESLEHAATYVSLKRLSDVGAWSRAVERVLARYEEARARAVTVQGRLRPDDTLAMVERALKMVAVA